MHAARSFCPASVRVTAINLFTACVSSVSYRNSLPPHNLLDCRRRNINPTPVMWPVWRKAGIPRHRHGHLRDDPRLDAGEDVCVGVRVRVGVMECQLNGRAFARDPKGRARVRISAGPLPGNNLGKAAHAHVPLSPSSIIWYRPMGGDAVQLGR